MPHLLKRVLSSALLVNTMVKVMDQDLYGAFAMAMPEFLEMESDDDDADMLLSQLVTSDLINCTQLLNIKELRMSADDDLPPPETLSDQNEQRFKCKTAEELKKYEDMHKSASTKKNNTKGGMEILQGT